MCARMTRPRTSTRVDIIMHHHEQWRSSNTARLAHWALPHSTLRSYGAPDTRLDAEHFDIHAHQYLVLFPTAGARRLHPDLLREDPRTTILVVPDGSWRQARRMSRRLMGWGLRQHVTLPPGAPSAYTLRRQAHDHHVSTFEAIARALGVLEGEHVEHTLLKIFRHKVRSELVLRGRHAMAADV